MDERLDNETGSDPEHKEWSREIADLLRSQGFDEETCEETADKPFDQAFEDAFSMLTQAEQNADELLAPWLEQPPQDE